MSAGNGCKQQAFIRHGCCGLTRAFGSIGINVKASMIQVDDNYFESEDPLFGKNGCEELKSFFRQHWPTCSECKTEYRKISPHHSEPSKVFSGCRESGKFLEKHFLNCRHCGKDASLWTIRLVQFLRWIKGNR